MDISNSIENKAKFFALYWGQNVFKEYGKYGINSYIVGYLDDHEHPNHFLELTPLSMITDEDAIFIWDIMHKGRDNNRDRLTNIELVTFGKRIPFSINYMANNQNTLEMWDYLRSKGYALPWMGLSVEELVKMGWVKLKQD